MILEMIISWKAAVIPLSQTADGSVAATECILSFNSNMAQFLSFICCMLHLVRDLGILISEIFM